MPLDQGRAQPLTITLDAIPAITGQVLAQGTPVPGAWVELVTRDPNIFGDELLPCYWNGLYNGVYGNLFRTDSSGKYRLSTEHFSGTHYVHVWSQGLSEGYSGPIKSAIELSPIELSPGCSLSGRLQGPENLDVSGIQIEVFRKEPQLGDMDSLLGQFFQAQTGANGEWAVDSLAAGPWLVMPRIPKSRFRRVERSSEWNQRMLEVPWLFIVPSGADRAEIGLTKESLYRIDCQLIIGSEELEGYAALFTDSPISLQVYKTDANSDSTFSLFVRSPGSYRVLVALGTGDGLYNTITDIIKVDEPITIWNRTIPIASWTSPGVRLDR